MCLKSTHFSYGGSFYELLHHLNGVWPTIKFTVEQEDGTLPFLDMLLRRREIAA